MKRTTMIMQFLQTKLLFENLDEEDIEYALEQLVAERELLYERQFIDDDYLVRYYK